MYFYLILILSDYITEKGLIIGPFLYIIFQNILTISNKILLHFSKFLTLLIVFLLQIMKLVLELYLLVFYDF
jgi:hypothetical protein